jgi:hypothetical protein
MFPASPTHCPAHAWSTPTAVKRCVSCVQLVLVSAASNSLSSAVLFQFISASQHDVSLPAASEHTAAAEAE